MSPVEPNFSSPESESPETTNESNELSNESEGNFDLSDVGAPVGQKTESASKPESQKEIKKEVEAKKEEIRNLKKKYNLVVDGKSEEMELDLANDEEVKKYLQKSRAADKRFQEASEVRKAALDFIEQLKTNPRRVLSDPNIGVDIKKFAEEILSEEIKEMEKSPEQREREKLQKELEDLRAQAKQREETARQQQFTRLQEEQHRILETDITTALDVGGIPKNPKTIARMADYMMVALQNGIDLSVKDVVPLVKRDIDSELKEIAKAIPDDKLEDFLGKEIISRLRKKNLAKAKSIQTASSVKSTGSTPAKKIDAPIKKQTIRDFLKV
jgi:DNA-binding ferritin-like protein (Dps family)